MWWNKRKYEKYIKKNFLSISIPLPPLENQHQIVAQIEKEQQLVNANKELIEIFEQKIKDRIAKVWGTPAGLSTGADAEMELGMVAEGKSDYNAE